MADEVQAKRTPTETLMRCLEEFGECEAVNCMVIWTDVAGDIAWSSSTDSQVSRFGMVEFVKQILIKNMGD